MEKVEIEFRYIDKKDNWEDSSQISKFFKVGDYETIDEAVKSGNEALNILAKKGFEIRVDDKFKVIGLFGSPDRLVSNTCYRDRVTFFAKITNVWNDDLNNAIDETLKARSRYDEFKKSLKEDD